MEKKSAEFGISMYKTPYTLIQRFGKWRYAPSNPMEMSPELAVAVIAAAFA